MTPASSCIGEQSAWDEFLDGVVAFEQTHEVEAYSLHGWRVWPYLRVAAGISHSRRMLRKCDGSKTDEHEAPTMRERLGRSVLARGARSVTRRLRRCSHGLMPTRRATMPVGDSADVVFVTHANRCESIAGAYWHPLADPLAEFLEANGYAPRIWGIGTTAGPRWREPLRVDVALEEQSRADVDRLIDGAGRAPKWFAEFSEWAKPWLRDADHWDGWRRRLSKITAQSFVIERWLRAAGCRAAFVDCWYDQTSMATTLAARRIGIPSIDYQHGHQGRTHFGYYRWSRWPNGGFDCAPGAFWVWGDDEASDPIPGRRLTGGNLWIRKWRSGGQAEFEQARREASELIGGSKSILVTTQPGVELEPVYDAIANSPSDWRWLIRFHRQTNGDARESTLDRLRGFGRAGVYWEAPTRLPLYALLWAVDCHMTGSSTCALEALSFGKPTVVFHAICKSLFAEQLREGVMRYADSGAAILEAVASLDALSREILERGAAACSYEGSGDVAAMLRSLIADAALSTGAPEGIHEP